VHGSILHAPRLVVPGTASWVGNTTVVGGRAARRLRPPSFRAPRLLFRAAVIPLVSIALASLWLALAITIASADAASASADDSRLLPSGPAAHLWLLPKVGNRATSEAQPNLHAAKNVAQALASLGGRIERSSLLRRPRELSRIPTRTPQRRLPPRRGSSDPPLAS
jgi:hypothetical protein